MCSMQRVWGEKKQTTEWLRFYSLYFISFAMNYVVENMRRRRLYFITLQTVIVV